MDKNVNEGKNLNYKFVILDTMSEELPRRLQVVKVTVQIRQKHRHLNTLIKRTPISILLSPHNQPSRNQIF